MSNILDSFRLSNIKRYTRIALFVTKWFGTLNSATMEIYLHHSFGRRYLRTLFGAMLFYIVCAALAPDPRVLTYLFFLGLPVMFTCHVAAVFQRPRRPWPPPHSFSTGAPWGFWQWLGCQETTVQRYVEPALCLLMSLPVSNYDLFLGLWLKAGAVSLFVKELINRVKITRRILDSLDAKHDAQALNTALKAHQQPGAQGAQSPQRAHLPPNPRQRHP